jgi:preprotein translocase subunit YajC
VRAKDEERKKIKKEKIFSHKIFFFLFYFIFFYVPFIKGKERKMKGTQEMVRNCMKQQFSQWSNKFVATER